MHFRFLADALVLVHLAFVLFVVLGGLLAFRKRWWAWVHLPAAFWGVVIELRGWVCPLTPLENHLRGLGGEVGYSGGFVEQYLIPILYPAGLTRSFQVGLGVFVLLFNLTVYAALVWRRCGGGGEEQA